MIDSKLRCRRPAGKLALGASDPPAGAGVRRLPVVSARHERYSCPVPPAPKATIRLRKQREDSTTFIVTDVCVNGGALLGLGPHRHSGAMPVLSWALGVLRPEARA